MTKASLIGEMLRAKGLPKLSKRATADYIDTIFDLVAKSIRRDKKFTYPGFGTWMLKKRKPRVGRNPKTGDSIQIPASKTVSFKPAPTFKKAITG